MLTVVSLAAPGLAQLQNPWSHFHAEGFGGLEYDAEEQIITFTALGIGTVYWYRYDLSGAFVSLDSLTIQPYDGVPYRRTDGIRRDGDGFLAWWQAPIESGAEAVLARLNEDGAQIWRRQFRWGPEGQYYFGWIDGVEKDSLGDNLVYGYWECGSGPGGSCGSFGYPQVTKLDNQGELLWELPQVAMGRYSHVSLVYEEHAAYTIVGWQPTFNSSDPLVGAPFTIRVSDFGQIVSTNRVEDARVRGFPIKGFASYGDDRIVAFSYGDCRHPLPFYLMTVTEEGGTGDVVETPVWPNASECPRSRATAPTIQDAQGDIWVAKHNDASPGIRLRRFAPDLSMLWDEGVAVNGASWGLDPRVIIAPSEGILLVAGDEGDDGSSSFLARIDVGTYTSIETSGIPSHRMRAYPNPSNGSITFEAEAESSTVVRLSIFDITGRLVDELVKQVPGRGPFGLSWSGTDVTGVQLPSGVYIAILVSGNRVERATVTLIRN